MSPRIAVRLALWQFRERPGRALLTGLSVAIAVATVVGVVHAINVTHRAQNQLYQALAGRTDIEVVARAGGSFDGQVLEKVRAVPGVAAVSPGFEQFTVLYSRGERVRLLAIGIDPRTEHRFRDFSLTAGRYLEAADEALLEAGFARRLGIQAGDSAKMLTRRQVHTVRIVGLVSGRDIPAATQGGALFLDLGDLQTLFRAEGRLDVVRVMLDPQSHADDVVTRIQSILPDSLLARTPTARTRLGETIRQTTNYLLILIGCLGVVSAATVLFNTFLMSISERQRQFETLRQVGATHAQIRGMLLLEALLLGVTGTAVGVPAGYWCGQLLSQAIANYLEMTLPELPGSPWPYLAGLALGPILSVVAVLAPAGRAGRMPMPDAARSINMARVSWIGAALVSLAAGGFLLPFVGLAHPMVYLVALLGGLIGTAMLVPALLAPITALATRLLQPWLGFDAQLARLQLLRAPTRTALTASMLFIAVCTTIGVGNTVLSLYHESDAWLEQSYPGDFFLRAMMPDQEGGASADLPANFEERLDALPGRRLIERFTWTRAQVNHDPAMLIIRDLDRYDHLPLHLSQGEPAEVRRRLLMGEAVLAGPLAYRLGARPGDGITLSIEGTERRLTVAGVANEYLFGGQALLMQRSPALAPFEGDGVDALLIQVAPDQIDAARSYLEALADEHGLLLQSFETARQYVHGLNASFSAGLWLLLAFVAANSLFGVANTMAMNVLEQTKELALLRIVGLEHGRLRRLIVVQALLLACVGVAAGGPVGVLFARLICLASELVYGNPMRFHAWAVFIGLCIGTAFLWCGLVALPPAWRAGRLNFLTAARER